MIELNTLEMEFENQSYQASFFLTVKQVSQNLIYPCSGVEKTVQFTTSKYNKTQLRKAFMRITAYKLGCKKSVVRFDEIRNLKKEASKTINSK